MSRTATTPVWMITVASTASNATSTLIRSHRTRSRGPPAGAEFAGFGVRPANGVEAIAHSAPTIFNCAGLLSACRAAEVPQSRVEK
jgi:hypothetical protein